MKNVFMFLLLLMGQLFAAVIVNSLDGRDVISATYYAALIGEKIVIAYPDSDLQNVFSSVGVNENVFLVQSEKNPVFVGLADSLKQRENKVTLFVSKDPFETNLELAKKSGVKRLILIDPIYGYNAVSTLPYGKQNKMFLIFVSKDNLDKATETINSIKPNEVLIYGYVDKEIKDALSKNAIAYKEINNGDKFDDNMEILNLYFSKNPSKKQVILADGNGIEDTIAGGDDPVLFIGQIVPISVYNYLKEKVAKDQITVGLVVDKDYFQTSYNLKQSINQDLGQKKFTVLAKIGQSAGGQQGSPAAVPLFPLRGPISGLSIEKVEYNTAKKAIEVIYKNTGNAQEYVKSSIAIYVNGNKVSVVGDEEPFILDKGAVFGRVYPIDIEEGGISVNITSFFGISKKNLDNGIIGYFDVGKVDYVDNSQIEITSINVDKSSGDIVVVFTNTGDIPAYFRADVLTQINNRSTKIEDNVVYSLKPNEGRAVKFIGIGKDSNKIIAGANYGSREAFLNKRVEKEYVESSTAFNETLLIGLVILLIIIVAVYFLVGKKK
ncbi:MAG: hypothetical protein QW255_01635 [Candidatus Bilamarchaeaceae archaeon]